MKPAHFIDFDFVYLQAEEKQAIEIKKLRNELLKASEKIATLSNQLLTSVRDRTSYSVLYKFS